MHAATMSALSVAVGLKEGFDSIIFGLALCLAVVVCIDTINVKNAASQQAEVVDLILKRIRRRRKSRLRPPKQRQSYTRWDVFSGVAIGVVFAMLIY
jgi:acid phosphatase family membrane protein YuiD